jgi:hypothetical protein
MSADPNKKSARSFQCRDVLWETFEQMARELECSVDYLINEAMKQYARQRSYGGTRTPYPAPQRPEMPASSQTGDRASAAPPFPAPPPPARAPSGGGGLPPPGGASRLPPPPGRPAPLPAPPPRGGLPAPPPPAARAANAAVAMPPVPRSVPPPPAGPRTMPPPLPRGATPVPPQASNGFSAPAQQSAALTLIYQGERHTVNKDRFVIGRGKQSSDLTLKDPNVSRQHAMIEFQNGVFFMVDMGSTNGVEYNGQRIARKQISEGDVFRICDHDLLFTYR